MLHVAIMVAFVFLYPAYWAFDESGHISRVISAEHGDLNALQIRIGEQALLGG